MAQIHTNKQRTKTKILTWRYHTNLRTTLCFESTINAGIIKHEKEMIQTLDEMIMGWGILLHPQIHSC